MKYQIINIFIIKNHTHIRYISDDIIVSYTDNADIDIFLGMNSDLCQLLWTPRFADNVIETTGVSGSYRVESSSFLSQVAMANPAKIGG